MRGPAPPSAERPLTVFGSPARRNRAANPYNYLLSEALAAKGCDVSELTRRNGVLGAADVIHIHWPQGYAKGPALKALQKSFELVLRLAIQRLRGAAVIWTAHNVHAHDQNRPRLERLLMGAVTRLVSGVIYLGDSSRAPVEAAYPALRSKPWTVIPHGLYGDLYSSDQTPAQAREAFGLTPDERVIGFIGDIRAYKGLDLLIEAFAQLPPSAATLFVAGALPTDDDEHASAVRDGLARLSRTGHRVVAVDQRLGNKEMVEAIRASDVAAFPYRRVANSGLAMLVLEHGGRLLTSDCPLFHELRAEAGADLVLVADKGFTGDALEAALAAKPSSMAIDDFRRTRAWSTIAERTVEFYRRCGARSAAGGTA